MVVTNINTLWYPVYISNGKENIKEKLKNTKPNIPLRQK